MNVDGSEPTTLVDMDSGATPGGWSPDGSKIVFQGNTVSRAPHDIYVMNTDGSDLVNVTNNPSGIHDISPSCSPDGTRIMFSRWEVNASQIWTMNADGSGKTQLTFTGASSAVPRWLNRKSVGAPIRREEGQISRPTGLGAPDRTANGVLTHRQQSTHIAFT